MLTTGVKGVVVVTVILFKIFLRAILSTRMGDTWSFKRSPRVDDLIPSSLIRFKSFWVSCREEDDPILTSVP